MVDDDEIIRTANKIFSKVGSVVKKAGATVVSVGKQAGSTVVSAGKQVTGVGRGSIHVDLDRTRFAPGDEITGKLTLELGDGVDGERLVVSLRALQRTVDYHRTGGIRTVGASQVLIYKFDNELGGTRHYASEELPFTLVVPRDAKDRAPPAPPAGRIGDVARAVASVAAPTAGPVEWRVVATLVVKLGRDLEHGVDVVVD